MKKLLLLLFVSALTQLNNMAQPTLTGTVSKVNVGDVFSTYDADSTGITDGPNGANQTWDFSSLVIGTTLQNETYLNPATTPYAASFATANIARDDAGDYVYVKSSLTDLRLEGFGTSIVVIPYFDDEVLLKYPFTYNSTYTDSLKANYSISGLNNYRRGKVVVTGVGYGKLILPSKTYNNVLKVRLHETILDSLQYFSSTFQDNNTYYWYDANTKFPLLTIDEQFMLDNSDNSTTVDKLISVNEVAVVGIHEKENLFHLSIFPNPVHNISTFSYYLNQSQEIKINILNSLGQSVFTKQMQNQSQGPHMENINLEDVVPGIYTISFQSGNDFEMSKLIIE